ncbi:hypothetical protein [Paenibacillus sp. 22594]
MKLKQEEGQCREHLAWLIDPEEHLVFTYENNYVQESGVKI